MERTRQRALDDPLDRAVGEVQLALAPLPDGYYVEADREHGTIMVCCKHPEPEGLGFVITAQTIQNDRHIQDAIKNLPELVKAVMEAGGPPSGPQAGSVQQH